jgi:hypothetical protein
MSYFAIPRQPRPSEDKVALELPDGTEKEYLIVEQDPTRQPPKKILNATVSLLLATVLVAFFVLIESKILNAPFTFRQNLLGPYLQVLHEWVLFVKHIYTFLKKAYPNNALTNTFEKIIMYVVDTIPYEPLKDYVKTAPQTVALRPHIKNALLESLTSLQTPENTPFINRLKEFFEEIEKLFEIGRILGIDQATLNKINSEDAKYIDLLHIINNYQTRFNQFMDYFIKLFNTILSTATTIDPRQEDAIFQSVSKITRSATDFQAANIVSKLLSEIIPPLIKDVDDLLQEKFAEEGPIEEIDGGKRKTRRRKTLSKKHRKQKTPSKKYRKQKSKRKKRSTRIIYQKLNKLSKFLLMQTLTRN